MSTKTEFQVVRHKHGKAIFEVLTRIGSVTKYRDGKLGFDNVLFADEIFTNFHKGEKAKATDLMAAFGTEDVTACLKVIVDKGELQLTTAERREKSDAKKNEVVNYIHKYYIDPRSKTPHPVARIENALDTLKLHIDPDIPVDQQLPDIIKRLPEVMPIKKTEIEAVLIIPNKHMGAAAGIVAKYVSVQREQYTSEGCRMEISMVPGDYDGLLSDLNKITKGEFQLDVVGAEAAGATTEDHGKGKGKGGAQRGGKGGGKGKK